METLTRKSPLAKKAELGDLLKFEESLGVEHVCIVCMSVYGNDNRLLLQSLRQLKGKGRGVVGIDPKAISDKELDEMHAVGVRGVRVNLKSTSQNLDKEALNASLRLFADKIRRLEWAIQLYVSLADIDKIADELPGLGVPVVIDHVGHPAATEVPRLQAGYSAFMDLLCRKQIWVKLSGIDRFPDVPELKAFCREILQIAPTQVVWASDWPHSGGVARNPDGDRTKVQDYRKVDIPAFIASCKEWCGGDEELIKKIFVDNPRRLWQYEEE